MFRFNYECFLRSAFSMITSGIVDAGRHGQAQAELAEAKLPILLRGRAQCPISFRRKINIGIKTNAFEKNVPISEMLRNTAGSDFEHLALLGRSLK